jgi:UPF0755 protein
MTNLFAPQRLLGRLVWGIVLVLLATVCCWLVVLDRVSQPLEINSEEQLYNVKPGATLIGMTEALEKLGLIENPFWLRIYGRLSIDAGTIKTGEYLLKSGMTQKDLLHLARSGKVYQRQFTIIEGWNFQRIRSELAAAEGLFQTIENMPDAQIIASTGIPADTIEGWLFPDTYQYVRGDSDISLLTQSVKRMQSILAQEWSGRDKSIDYSNPRQALILASIIEKETGLDSDRDKIAAVFYQRWKKRIRLQSDPTVIYGLGATFDGDLRRSDLRKKTPYNTYTNYGLPPSPICSPGRESIHAALNPANITSLYFVSRGDGSSEFSDTLEEHNRAVRRYQLRKDN